jgi:hypothetical protein
VTSTPVGATPLGTRGERPTRPRDRVATTSQNRCEPGGVLSYQRPRVGRPHPTGDDPTLPTRSCTLPPRGRPVPTGDTGVLPPSASSWHRGTGRAGSDRTRHAHRSAQAA